MSHFPLAVFTHSRPTKTQLSCQLAPYQETIENPNSKWDAWRVGGRWFGKLIISSNADDFIISRLGSVDRRLFPGAVDGARIGDLDLLAMAEKERCELGEAWDQANAFIEEHGKIDASILNTQEITRSHYIEQAASFTPFAYIQDGQWNAKGEMGWLGVVDDPRPDAEWERQFMDVLAQQPDDHWITILDCHI